MPELIDDLKLNVTSPAKPLAGLDAAEVKLKSIDQILTSIKGKLAGNAFAGRSTGTLQNQLLAQGKRPFTPKDIAAAFGLPDVRQVEAALAQYRQQFKGSFSRVFSNAQGGFIDTQAAAKFSRFALKNIGGNPLQTLSQMLGGGGGGGGGGGSSGGGGGGAGGRTPSGFAEARLKLLQGLESQTRGFAGNPGELAALNRKAASNLQQLSRQFELSGVAAERTGLEIEKLRTKALKQANDAFSGNATEMKKFTAGIQRSEAQRKKEDAERRRIEPPATSEQRFRRTVAGSDERRTSEQRRAEDAEFRRRETLRRSQQRVFDQAQRDATRPATPPPLPNAPKPGFIENFAGSVTKVARWAAAVLVVQKAAQLATSSLAIMIDTGAQTARLEQVFRGVGGSAKDLVNDVQALAAANGRSSEEAIQAAIQWSRLGLTRVEVNEAVKVSLQAANIAEISASEATEKLSAIMAAYGLSVADVSVELAQLNAISNTANVTVGQMLEGLTRTASVAKQAGIPLAELNGIIGAAVAQTGQSGANIGNAVKSITVALSNPILQQVLRGQFGLEVLTGDSSGIKQQTQFLGELWERYQQINQQQKTLLTTSIAGKTQASRLVAILDSYVKGQVQAIQSQNNLNTAQQENDRILATLKSRITGLTTAWEQFVTVQGNNPNPTLGGASANQVLSDTVLAVKNIIGLLSVPIDKDTTGGLLKLFYQSRSPLPFLPGAIKSFNDAIDQSGGNKQFMQDLSFDAELQASRAASRAAGAGQAARLFGRLKNVLPGQSQEDASKNIGVLDKILPADVVRQLQAANSANDTARIGVILEEQKTKAIGQQLRFEKLRDEQTQKAIHATDRSLELANQTGDTKASAAAEAQLAKLTEKRAADAMATADGLELQVAMEQNLNAQLEKTRGLTEQIRSLYQDIPANGPLQQFNLETASLEVQVAMLQRRRELLVGSGDTGSDQFNATKIEIATLQNQLKNRSRGFAEFRDRFQFGKFQAGVDTRTWETGNTEGESLINRLHGIRQQIAGIAPGGGGNAIEAGRLAELQSREYQTQLDLRMRQAEVEREITQSIIDQKKEFSKSILGAGPGEMLRKLAAFKLNQSGTMGLGQFLGLSPEMRGDIGQLNPKFNPHIGDLNRENEKLKKAGALANNEDFLKGLQGIGQKMAENLKAMQQPVLDEAARMMKDLGAAAMGAANALNLLPGIIQQVMAAMGNNVPMNGPRVDLPQNPGLQGLNAGQPVQV